jgi:hypothetical protein
MKLSGVWTGREMSTRFYYVIAKVSNHKATKTVTQTEVQYWVKIINPCLREGEITGQAIADLDYWIKDTPLGITFSDFSDYASTKYADYGTNLCGPKKYEIYAADKAT